MMASNALTKSRFTLLALLVLIMFLWGIGVRSFWLRIREVRDEISVRTKELSYQKGILAKEEVFAKRYKQVKELVNPGAGGPDERLSLIIDQAERWAKEEGLTVHDVRPLPSENENRVMLLRVALEMEGEMTALNRFLYKVMSSKDPLQIDRMNFAQKVRQRPQINLDIELSFLYLE